MKYINYDENIVIEFDEKTLSSKAINVKDLASQIEDLERGLVEFPELSDEDLLAWARSQKYPLERLQLRETFTKQIEKLKAQLDDLSPKEKEGEARLDAWR